MPRTDRRSKTKARQTDLAVAPHDRIERSIREIRGQRVMLDTDLAGFYGVTTGALNRAVKRNQARFPSDFCFQLARHEHRALRCQNGTLNGADDGTTPGSRRGKHRKYLPFAFTEHGAIMAASVLNSPQAVQMSVLVVRAFVRLRQLLADHRDLARRIEALEREFAHKTEKHEEHIRRIYEILDELMNPPEPPRTGRIGFVG